MTEMSKCAKLAAFLGHLGKLVVLLEAHKAACDLLTTLPVAPGTSAPGTSAKEVSAKVDMIAQKIGACMAYTFGYDGLSFGQDPATINAFYAAWYAETGHTGKAWGGT